MTELRRKCQGKGLLFVNRLKLRQRPLSWYPPLLFSMVKNERRRADCEWRGTGVLNVNFRTPATHKMAPWVRSAFIDFLPRYLFIQRPDPDPSSEDVPELASGKLRQIQYFYFIFRSNVVFLLLIYGHWTVICWGIDLKLGRSEIRVLCESEPR